MFPIPLVGEAWTTTSTCIASLHRFGRRLSTGIVPDLNGSSFRCRRHTWLTYPGRNSNILCKMLGQLWGYIHIHTYHLWIFFEEARSHLFRHSRYHYPQQHHNHRCHHSCQHGHYYCHDHHCCGLRVFVIVIVIIVFLVITISQSSYCHHYCHDDCHHNQSEWKSWLSSPSILARPHHLPPSKLPQSYHAQMVRNLASLAWLGSRKWLGWPVGSVDVAEGRKIAEQQPPSIPIWSCQILWIPTRAKMIIQRISHRWNSESCRLFLGEVIGDVIHIHHQLEICSCFEAQGLAVSVGQEHTWWSERWVSHFFYGKNEWYSSFSDLWYFLSSSTWKIAWFFWINRKHKQKTRCDAQEKDSSMFFPLADWRVPADNLVPTMKCI